VVVETPAAEGSPVDEGALLVRFDATDADLAVREARAALAMAYAQLAQAEAGAREEQVAVIEAQLAAAEAALAQAAAQRDEAQADVDEADILAARAGVMEAELAHKEADETHDDMMKCYDVPQPDGSEEKICPTLGTYEEITRYQMEAAYAAMMAARAQLDAAKAGVDPERNAAQAAVQAALARRDTVEAQLALVKAGSQAEAVAVAETGVARAETAVAQAEASLAYTVVEAPFAGVVTDLAVDAGDTASAGAPLVTLATLDRLRVETTDLSELDVVDVAVGRPARVTLEARPDSPLLGHVARIDPQGTDYLGDVIYTAVVELDGPAPDWLRWGMTAQVEIAKAGVDLPPAAPKVAAEADATAVIAEAALEPARWSALSFEVGERVVDVPVTNGDPIAAGDVVARLDAVHATLALESAEAAVATARAELALVRAGPRAEAVEAAEADLAAAQGDLRRAVALRDQLKAGGPEAELAGARARLEADRAAYRQAVILTGDTDDADELKQLAMLDLKVRASEQRVASLPDVFAARLRGANAGVVAAQAQVEVAEAQLALLQAPPTDAEVAAAEAEVQQAEVALAAARVDLARTELRAPFDGTVTQVYIEEGEIVGAGRPVVMLAALDRQQLVTLDLTELDVAALEGGQPVQVTVDALPDRDFAGHIVRIKRQSVDYRGDVAYPVTIDLDEAEPELRWGMRAVVRIAAP
jgi:multidrug resistance efflux pump